MTQDSRVQVAIAILHQDDQFLMQLRDPIPTILYPGYWAFFGGHIEPGETPEIAVVREILEEVNYKMPSVTKFGIYDDDRVIRHVFAAPFNVGLADLTLTEGWDMDLLTVEDIQRGDRFSANANEVRPLSPIHQRILLDFIESRQNRDST
jgi:8-oxo-dGTP pyrophosphatase MutT (NUDIX family)